MIRILFLIRTLEYGGAERQLVELVKGMDKTRFSVTVATFYDGGELSLETEGLAGVHVASLHKKGRWDLLPFLWRLWRVVAEGRPQIIHGYMGASNGLSLVMGRLSGAKVVWGVRGSSRDWSRYDWVARLVFRLERALSRFADLIIVNSKAGWEYHLAHGFPAEKMIVIANGIATDRFYPDPAARQRIREEFGVTESDTLIGLVARLEPIKDHQTFLKAAALLAQERDDARFVCVGDGPVTYREELLALCRELRLTRRVIWAGARGDMPAVHNALDIASCSSYGEGFPNVIGEAMACGVPCVATDVGDAAWIIGDTGIVVPPRNPEALADGWRAMLRYPRDYRLSLGEKARAHIVLRFGRDALVRRTSEALLGLL